MTCVQTVPALNKLLNQQILWLLNKKKIKKRIASEETLEQNSVILDIFISVVFWVVVLIWNLNMVLYFFFN